MNWEQILKEDPIGWIIGAMDMHYPSMQIIPRPDYYFFGTEQQVIEETKKYQKTYLEYLKKSSKKKKPRKGAFTGPAAAHTKSKFDGRAVGINTLMGKILKLNGWVKNKDVYEKIHERKERKIQK